MIYVIHMLRYFWNKVYIQRL